MTEAKTVQIQLAKGSSEASGEEVVLRFSGDDPETYKVTDGSIRVPKEREAQFLAQFAGAEVVAGNTSGDNK